MKLSKTMREVSAKEPIHKRNQIFKSHTWEREPFWINYLMQWITFF